MSDAYSAATENLFPPRLATSKDIVYKAYQRPYDEEGGQVITLLVSCSHAISNYNLFFEGEEGPGEKFKLMEQVPRDFFSNTTFYVASCTTGIGLENPAEFVTIEDAFGVHKVLLEDFDFE